MAGSAPHVTSGGRRRTAFALIAALAPALVLGACSSGDDTTSARSTSSDPSSPSTASSEPAAAPTTSPLPTVPPGGTDCGSISELAGWPTTTTSFPDRFDCIVDAFADGTPARMVVTSVGAGTSGRETADGYDVPTRVVTAWVVTGPGEVEHTTDRTEDGGTVTVEVCSGLTVDPTGALTATGCTSR